MPQQGKAVNVLDLGTMYIAMKCNAKGKSDVAENGSFCIKFTPTTLAKGKPCRISGSRLKLGGNGCGIFFAPVDSAGNMNDDETSWTSVSHSTLFRNMPSELNFFVPDSLEEGKYKIVLRTAYLGKDKSRKNIVEAASDEIMVKAE